MFDFDTRKSPTMLPARHRFSIGTDVPGAERIEAVDRAAVRREGDWSHRCMRCTATHLLSTSQEGAALRVRFECTNQFRDVC